VSAAGGILVIKLGALGDVVQALGPLAAIRRHHAGAEITLLTTAPFADFLGRSPYVDRVWVDPRAPWWRLDALLALRRKLNRERFARVYDLQTSARSSRYFQLWPRDARPEWSGIARGCSHPDADPLRDTRHDIERQRGQLAAAGIATVPDADLAWTGGDLARFALPDRFALLVPGSAPHRPAKRWPVRHYAALAETLDARGLLPVVVGSAAERDLGAALTRAGARDLTGRTTLGELVALARRAELAIGNDTGPMHLAAAAGCRAIVLFSRASDPALCAPRGPRVTVVRRPDLADLVPQDVVEMI